MSSVLNDSLPTLLVDQVVQHSLYEDWGRGGDLTSLSVLPAACTAEGQVIARQAGYICGLACMERAFILTDPRLQVTRYVQEGTPVTPGTLLAQIVGPARALLSAERVALNFLGHLSGIATSTNAFVTALNGTKAQIVCTRKTTPGLRVFEKYAVRCGGGRNHRFGLDDGILVKDNHIALAGGLRAALKHLNRNCPRHFIPIQVEIDSLAQLQEILDEEGHFSIQAVLLDNMSPPQLSEAVRRVGGRLRTEASGGVTQATIQAIAQTGVDFISVGWITHSAPCLDVALDVRSRGEA